MNFWALERILKILKGIFEPWNSSRTFWKEFLCFEAHLKSFRMNFLLELLSDVLKWIFCTLRFMTSNLRGLFKPWSYSEVTQKEFLAPVVHLKPLKINLWNSKAHFKRLKMNFWALNLSSDALETIFRTLRRRNPEIWNSFIIKDILNLNISRDRPSLRPKDQCFYLSTGNAPQKPIK